MSEGVWPILKIALAFAAMLAGIRMRLSVWISILAGSLVLALSFGLKPVEWAAAAFAGLFDLKALYLALIVWAIMAMSGILEKTGQTERLMEAMRGYLGSPRLGLVFFPALIGLLPMPGGAVFSAPMVKSLSERMGLEATDKVVVNYWFRHVWELAWPLYPGIILAASLADIPLTRLVAYDLPGVALCIVLGWVFVIRPGRLPMAQAAKEEHPREPRRVLVLGLPLITAILGAIGLELLMSVAAPGADYELGVLAALAAGFFVAAVQNRTPPAHLGRYLFGGHLLKMVLVIAAIFVFKENMTRSGVVDELAGLAGGGAAVFAAAVFLPFLVGFVSGITIAYVGATFPLLLGLIEQLGLDRHLMAYMVLGMFSGFAGVMASPIHICFVLTCQYFGVPLAGAWRRIAAPALVLLVSGFAYFLILH
jgi:integral membrane protein (TIGR00529 family)